MFVIISCTKDKRLCEVDGAEKFHASDFVCEMKFGAMDQTMG